MIGFAKNTDRKHSQKVWSLTMSKDPEAEILSKFGDYQYGFKDPENYVFKSQKGLDEEVIRQISAMKGEPEWMLQFRLRAFKHFQQRPTPQWGADLSDLDLDDIYYYVKPTEMEGRTWDDVPEDIKDTFDKLGIPEAEQKYLSGVGAQYESEMIYHNVQDALKEQGVIFVSIEDGLRQHPEQIGRASCRERV
jgi:Fe-S cluster assembly protein SufB